MLDGSRCRNGLLDGLVTLVQTGSMNLRQNGKPCRDPEEARAILCESLDRSLETLAEKALLMNDT